MNSVRLLASLLGLGLALSTAACAATDEEDDTDSGEGAIEGSPSATRSDSLAKLYADAVAEDFQPAVCPVDWEVKRDAVSTACKAGRTNGRSATWQLMEWKVKRKIPNAPREHAMTAYLIEARNPDNTQRVYVFAPGCTLSGTGGAKVVWDSVPNCKVHPY
jgi:hypothetical protein